MRFREFFVEDINKDDDPLRVEITSLLSQLRARYEDSGAKKPYTVDSVLNILKKDGITLSKDDLYDIIQDDPIKNIISDFDKGVTFKGTDSSDKTSPTDDSAKIVKDKAIQATKSM